MKLISQTTRRFNLILFLLFVNRIANMIIGNRRRPFVSVNEAIQAKERSITSLIFRFLENANMNKKINVSRKFKLNKRGQDHHKFPCAAGEKTKIVSIDKNNQ